MMKAAKDLLTIIEKSDTRYVSNMLLVNIAELAGRDHTKVILTVRKLQASADMAVIGFQCS